MSPSYSKFINQLEESFRNYITENPPEKLDVTGKEIRLGDRFKTHLECELESKGIKPAILNMLDDNNPIFEAIATSGLLRPIKVGPISGALQDGRRFFYHDTLKPAPPLAPVMGALRILLALPLFVSRCIYSRNVIEADELQPQVRISFGTPNKDHIDSCVNNLVDNLTRSNHTLEPDLISDIINAKNALLKDSTVSPSRIPPTKIIAWFIEAYVNKMINQLPIAEATTTDLPPIVKTTIITEENDKQTKNGNHLAESSFVNRINNDKDNNKNKVR